MFKKNFEHDKKGFVRFGEVAHDLLGQQTQYAVRYVDGFRGESPNCGEGLRFEGDPANYHELRIHLCDIPLFVARVLEYKVLCGTIQSPQIVKNANELADELEAAIIKDHGSVTRMIAHIASCLRTGKFVNAVTIALNDGDKLHQYPTTGALLRRTMV